MESGTEISSPNKGEPTLHHVHCDPNVDVTIISNDNVELRASSFQLSKFSGFFADTFSLPPPNNHRREPIHLDFKSETIANFLDLMLLPQLYQEHAISALRLPSIIGPLIVLSQFAMCKDDLIDKLRDALRDRCYLAPFQVLKFASDHEENDLAATAIKNFHRALGPIKLMGPSYSCEGERQQNAPRWEMICFDFAQLSSQCQMGLFTLLLLATYTNPQSEKSMEVMWNKIGEAFDPSSSMYDKIAKLQGWNGWNSPNYEDE
ncbi:uncharacterized protein I206_104003 [Kwoniella pini CBS 10737]|uniref:BTB domain-containing protein n=1 Tax=Kwoniella pini CBS 10737 TaxID=1296096 RepID=A0A1B9I2X4_9TREE|nr:uncharacterized protein I206_04423 [Kwoniella pini CBS 10737]OCF49893.1 hypothetical protein I206_04423 [Kwoniella pini CBS 10737]